MTIRRFFQSIGLFAFLIFTLRSNAGIFIVIDANDTTNITSLRGAVIAANRLGGNNTILLGDLLNFGGHSHSTAYQLTIPGTDEGAALTGDLNITRGRTTIMGFTSGVTIDATGLGDRVFNVSSNAQLTLENLTITGGNAVGMNYGGAIYNNGTLSLKNCALVGNSSGNGDNLFPFWNGGDGGAIYNSGQMTMENCVVAENICGTGSNGLIDQGSNGGNGGGIRNDGFSRLSNCIIRGNQSGAGGGPGEIWQGDGGSGGNGGGIFNSGTLILDQCVIGENAAGAGAGGAPSVAGDGFGWNGGSGGNGGCGGGIYNVGELEIDYSTIYGDNAGNGGNGGSLGMGGNAGTGGNGGGIFYAGDLDLNNSTISSNSCGIGGNGGSGAGGGYGGTAGGEGGSGGGIYNSDGSLTLTSSTITLNTCGAGGNAGNGLTIYLVPGASGGNGGDGGGIANNADAAAVLARNSLIAQNLVNIGGAAGTNMEDIEIYGSPQIGNPGADGTGFDVSGNFTSQKFNLISTGDGSTGFTNGVNTDQIGSDASPIDPLLGPLLMNGGFTPTHALLWGSPAIDQGNCFKIHTDQRGHHRPHIYSSISKPSGGDGSDIGAFELDTRQD